MKTNLFLYILTLLMTMLGFKSNAQHSQLEEFIRDRNENFNNFSNGQFSPKEALLNFDLIQKKYNNLTIEYYVDLRLYKSMCYYYDGKINDAIKEYKEGISITKKIKSIGKDTLLFKLFSDLSNVYRNINEIDSAQFYLEAGKYLFKTNQDLEFKIPLYILSFFNNYGIILQKKGDYKTSNSYLLKELEISKRQNVFYTYDFIYSSISQNFTELGDYAKAKNYLKESLKYEQRPEDIADKHLKISDLYLKEKNPQKAWEHIKLAKKNFENSEFYKAGAKMPWFELKFQIYAGNTLLALGKKQEATNYFKKALTLNQFYFKNTMGVSSAQAYLGLGEITQDIQYFQKAIIASHSIFKNENINQNPDYQGIIAPKELSLALQKKAQILCRTNPALATKTYISTLNLAAKIRRSFNLSESKLFYTERIYPTFGDALAITYQQIGGANDAQAKKDFFEILEASKAATLADILLEQHIRPKNIDAKLLNEEAKLRSQAVSLQMKLAELKDETQREKVSNDLNEILIKSESLSKQFEKDSKSYYQLKYNFSTISIPQIQAKLDPQTAFVSYFLGEKNYAFLITKTSSKVIQLTDNLSLENNTKALVSALYHKPGLDVYKGSSQAQSLYNVLLKPFEKELADKTNLIVLRDGNLNFLPFEVLEKSPNDYLVKHFAISYGYSATILFNSLNNSRLMDKNNLMAIAPYTSKEHLLSSFRDKTLQPLPASGEEVAKIGGDIYTDQQATKNRFLETYQQHGIIHFATHAQVDDREAGRSFIAFYPDSSGYKLYTEELYNLSLQKTRLVVLSACETGRGQLHHGEGILSLARAFAYAGCPSVVATLWNAHDESTAFLSERLHHYLQEKLPIDLALQRAKLDYFNAKIGKELDHPYYWANFILLGNAQPVNEEVGWAWWAWALFLLGGIVVVLLFTSTSRKFLLLSGSSVSSTSRK